MTTWLFDGRTIRDHYWGIGRYAFHLARAVAESAPSQPLRILYNPRADNTRFDFSQLRTLTNIELAPTSAEAFSLSEQLLAFRRILRSGTALYHAPYYALPYALSLPLVVTLADLTPLVIPQEMPSAARRIVYRTLNQLAARRSRQVITFSRASRHDLITYLSVPENKITVVPLAPFETLAPPPLDDVKRAQNKLDLPARYLLYLGINKPHKNLLRLIQAFALLRADAALVVAGHWDARFPEAKIFVAKNQLQEKVLFRHDISDRDLPALLGGAQAFVFPSVHEGFGLPPLEAMSCGAPVLCSNASSLPEVVGDAALLFDPFNVDEIANALTQVLDDPNLRARLQAKGFQQAKQFSWTRTARETIAVYRRTTSAA